MFNIFQTENTKQRARLHNSSLVYLLRHVRTKLWVLFCGIICFIEFNRTFFWRLSTFRVTAARQKASTACSRLSAIRLKNVYLCLKMKVSPLLPGITYTETTWVESHWSGKLFSALWFMCKLCISAISVCLKWLNCQLLELNLLPLKWDEYIITTEDNCGSM